MRLPEKWRGSALLAVLTGLAFMGGRCARQDPPTLHIASQSATEERLRSELKQASARVLELEGMIATLRQSTERVRVQVRSPDGWVRTTSASRSLLEQHQETARSSAAEKVEQAATSQAQTRSATLVQRTERALTRYRFGLDVGAELKDLSPTLGGNAAIRLGGTAFFLTGALIPANAELRIGLSFER